MSRTTRHQVEAEYKSHSRRPLRTKIKQSRPFYYKHLLRHAHVLQWHFDHNCSVLMSWYFRVKELMDNDWEKTNKKWQATPINNTFSIFSSCRSLLFPARKTLNYVCKTYLSNRGRAHTWWHKIPKLVFNFFAEPDQLHIRSP